MNFICVCPDTEETTDANAAQKGFEGGWVKLWTRPTGTNTHSGGNRHG